MVMISMGAAYFSSMFATLSYENVGTPELAVAGANGGMIMSIITALAAFILLQNRRNQNPFRRRLRGIIPSRLGKAKNSAVVIV